MNDVIDPSSRDLNALLDRLLARGENEVVEFKEAKRQYSADRVGEYVSALSNEANLRESEFAWLIFGVDDAAFLGKAGLTRHGGITRAALLLLGTDEASIHLSPHMAEMSWKLVGEVEAYEHFRLPFLLNASELSKRIRNIKVRLMPPDELIYREITKYDERSILEALYNAIAHQDYRAHARIVVVERADRLEFISSGSFFDGTPEAYALGDRAPQSYRNPFLVEAMTRLNLIDHMGAGIHRMVRDQIGRFLPLPDYDLTRPGEVKLTIPGAVIDKAYSQQLMLRTDLPLADVLALDHVQKGQPVSEAALRRLKRHGLVEGRRPHLHVSAAVAEATGTQPEYIRARAQDEAHYRRLVADYLREFERASRQQIDALLGKYLDESLSDEQRRNKVDHVLRKMRRQGEIVNEGTRKQSSWRLLP